MAAAEDLADAQDTTDLGLVGSLPNRADLNQVLARLPESTKFVRLLFISGEFNFSGSYRAHEHLRHLAAGQTRVEYLGLDPDRIFVSLRVLEDGVRDPAGLRARIVSRASAISKMLDDARRAHRPLNAEYRTYDLWPVWRLVFVDDLVYASTYPLRHDGGFGRVWMFRADPQERSFYWTLLKEYARHWYDGELRAGADRDGEARVAAIHHALGEEVRRLLHPGPVTSGESRR